MGSTSHAEIFTVLNNNDSGPNSFREALTKAAANGNSEIDYIYFNIPGNTLAEHTIKLLTDLPSITTDLVIDGSTQPGIDASINGAKIILDGSNFAYQFFSDQSVLKVSEVNIFEMYGMVIKNFFTTFIGSITGPRGIYFTRNTKKAIIGAVGKGNVFYNAAGITTNFDHPTDKGSIQSLTLTNNFFGILEDGVNIATVLGTSSHIYRSTEVKIGGETPMEGNLIYGLFELYPAGYLEALMQNTNITVKNNIFTANKNEERPNVTVAKNSIYTTFGLAQNMNHPASSKLAITDNVFGSALTLSGFDNADILISRNFFGTSRDLTKKLPVQAQLLNLNSINGRVMVGGIATQEGNIFTNANDDLPFLKLYPGAVWSQSSNTIELSHNSFLCNPSIPFLYANTGPFDKALEVFLDDVTPSTVSGRSKPGARIELFYSDPECTNCQPKRYFATVIADPSGNWKYTGTIEIGYSILASATINQMTSEFSDPRIYMINAAGKTFKITHQTCDNPNGKIEGAFTVNAKSIEWVNEAGQVVGTSLNLVNIPAGKYRIKALQFGCIVYSEWVVVEDQRPALAFTATPNIVHPSCGNLGSILNLFPNYYKDFSWLDANGRIVGKDRELKNVPAGSYTLHLVGLTDCEKDFGPYVINNVSGPNADLSNMALSNTTCAANIGSIKGILASGTGNLTYKWTDRTNAIVATSLDLENIGAGSYRLEIKDESACPPLILGPYDISEDGAIVLNESQAVFKASACSSATGYVKGILVSGATSYTWFDKAGNQVSFSRELENIKPGEYKLVASNGLGCTKESKYYIITESQPRVFPDYNITVVNASCNLNNGSLSINLGTGIVPASMKWVNETNQTVGTTATINNLATGLYKLYLKDENGCEVLYKSSTINRIAPLAINEGAINIASDLCGQGIGAINNIIVTGGQAPYQYSWKNQDQQQIGTTPNLSNLSAGSYTLSVTDALNCEVKTLQVVIQNQSSSLETPIVDPISICAPTKVNIAVKNVVKDGTYRLYSSLQSTQPIAEQKNGVFQIDVATNSSFYVTQFLGNCESAKGIINIELNGAELKIPSSFSPNGDGVNDLWSIAGLDKYPWAQVKIFNRLGAKVFEYTGSALKFDGKYNGSKLPPGVYYYVISLSENCRQLSGSLLIL
ncbi:gliding motility-associated C-terminal domain-containing protein [Pedobacter sp. KR3-3]|uniref:Gliding motility-associated C-terminal domain-containing protein n=1 Tax=Pedobacter albus TaxID=3113905 RepID=A0ABU7I6A6_9SPHI|nr:gliding motility-associated C-terminal domain-containing protein [Pedobacter sp. KR3-3]MEE1945003.1 gliding motility-associated C-terminal domain-containing protein [Pedobacter sp. KR3-3]